MGSSPVHPCFNHVLICMCLAHVYYSTLTSSAAFYSYIYICILPTVNNICTWYASGSHASWYASGCHASRYASGCHVSWYACGCLMNMQDMHVYMHIVNLWDLSSCNIFRIVWWLVIFFALLITIIINVHTLYAIGIVSLQVNLIVMLFHSLCKDRNKNCYLFKSISLDTLHICLKFSVV